MKVLFGATITSSFLICASVSANETTEITQNKVKKAHPHNISFGPEVFWFDVHACVKNILINDCKFFFGARIQYEYIKPKAFYAGVDLLSARGYNGFRARYHDHNFSPNSGINTFGHFEMRFGYTFAPNKWLLSPYLGMGGYGMQLGRGAPVGFKETVVYSALGLRSRRNITDNFYAGFNLKVFFADDSYRRYERYFTDHPTIRRTEHPDMWGGEIEVPVGWRLGSRKHWNVQIEPYFIKLNFTEVQNIYGTRLMFGYRF